MASNWLDRRPVMLVDEHGAGLVFWRRELSEHLTVLTAATADEAMDRVHHHNIAAVVCDARGQFAWAQRLFDRTKQVARQPVCVCVADSEELSRWRAEVMAGRCDAVLAAPSSPEELSRTLVELFGARRKEKARRQAAETRRLARIARRYGAIDEAEGRKLRHDMKNVISAGQIATDMLAKRIRDAADDLPVQDADGIAALLVVLRGAFSHLDALREGTSPDEEQPRQSVTLAQLLHAIRPLMPVPAGVSLRVIGDLQARVQANRLSLSRAIINLVDNACRAARMNGTVTIAVQCRDGMAWIDVADDGPGVPAELRERVFEAGFTTRGLAGGTGLGLSTCRELIRAQGGDVQLVVTDGPGATFRVLLPMVSGDDGREVG